MISHIYCKARIEFVVSNIRTRIVMMCVRDTNFYAFSRHVINSYRCDLKASLLFRSYTYCNETNNCTITSQYIEYAYRNFFYLNLIQK